MSLSATPTAELGDPVAGSQTRGVTIVVVPASHLPQARIFPVGSWLMCNGTMSQETGASHWPVVASTGRAFTVIVAEVMPAEPVLKRRVWAPVPAIPRSTNLATPLALVVAVSEPWRVPEPLATVAVTTTPGTATPLPSFTRTLGCRAGSQTSRSSALVGGWVLILIVAGAPASSTAPGVSGWVGSSPPQVAAAATKAEASSRLPARPIRVRISEMG